MGELNAKMGDVMGYSGEGAGPVDLCARSVYVLEEEEEEEMQVGWSAGVNHR
jgi:hypothetical protein